MVIFWQIATDNSVKVQLSLLAVAVVLALADRPIIHLYTNKRQSQYYLCLVI